MMDFILNTIEHLWYGLCISLGIAIGFFIGFVILLGAAKLWWESVVTLLETNWKKFIDEISDTMKNDGSEIESDESVYDLFLLESYRKKLERANEFEELIVLSDAINQVKNGETPDWIKERYIVKSKPDFDFGKDDITGKVKFSTNKNSYIEKRNNI